MTDVKKQRIEHLATFGSQPRTILAALQKEFHGDNTTLRDIYNIVQHCRIELLGTRTLIEALLFELQSSDCFHRYTTNEADNRIESLFFADSKAAQICKQ